MIAQSTDTKTYKIFLATETLEIHYDKKLFVCLIFDDGLRPTHLKSVLPLRLNSTVDDENQAAVDYALRYAPEPTDETKVQLLSDLRGIATPANSGITPVYIPSYQNPAVPLLKAFRKEKNLYR